MYISYLEIVRLVTAHSYKGYLELIMITKLTLLL